MSFSDETQEYLLVRPPQSNKLGKHTAHNFQIQRLLPATSSQPVSPTRLTPRPRIKPILNLQSHAVRKSRIVETETGQTLCKFDREPRGVLGKWQVDLRRGDGGGWIFVSKYERYEWAKSRGVKGGDTWKLVRSTYSHTKSIAATKPRKSALSESKTTRPSIDDTSPERRLSAKITIVPNVPPSVVVSPRNPRDAGSDEVEAVNKEEVFNALIQGLWIVWREGIVEDITVGRRNSWTPGRAGNRKRSFMDRLLCRS